MTALASVGTFLVDAGSVGAAAGATALQALVDVLMMTSRIQKTQELTGAHAELVLAVSHGTEAGVRADNVVASGRLVAVVQSLGALVNVCNKYIR